MISFIYKDSKLYTYNFILFRIFYIFPFQFVSITKIQLPLATTKILNIQFNIKRTNLKLKIQSKKHFSSWRQISRGKEGITDKENAAKYGGEFIERGIVEREWGNLEDGLGAYAESGYRGSYLRNCTEAQSFLTPTPFIFSP